VASPTQIANLALSWLGQNQINSFSDNQNEAIVMNANYALSRDKALNDAAWTFALRRQTLAPIVDAPVFGAGNKFLIPNDVLRVHRVYRSSNTNQSDQFTNARWTREGQYIFSNEQTLWCHFIVRVTDTNLFSASFVHALAARLAADTALTFTENIKLQETMELRYIAKLAEAKYADGSQGRTEKIRSNSRLTGSRTR
jgi:hypothetical protein